MRGVLGPWWAWLGVLVASAAGILSRGIDFSDGWSGLLTILSVLGFVLSLVVITEHVVRKSRGSQAQSDDAPSA